MIAETPLALLVALVVTTLLGIVMGYCIAIIRTRRASALAMESIRSAYSRENTANETDLRSTRASIDNLRSSLHDSNNRANVSQKREEALELHALSQAQRIQTLESHVSSYEDQQIRLKRDFANYKSTTTRELEHVRSEAGTSRVAEQVPVLSRRSHADDGRDTGEDIASRAASTQSAADSVRTAGFQTVRENTGLSEPLTTGLDIPSLSESELPDSFDQVEFDMADLDSTGGWPRG